MDKNEIKFTKSEREKKIELITQILNYPQYKDESLDKQVERFDYLYDKPLSELIIYAKVYK